MLEHGQDRSTISTAIGTQCRTPTVFGVLFYPKRLTGCAGCVIVESMYNYLEQSKMARPKLMPYFDFNEYEQNDPQYLLKILAGQLHDYQPKMVFRDGSSYNVTKTGNRYWRYCDYDGEYIGFKGQHPDGYTYWYCYLSDKHFDNARDFWQEAHFLTE